MNAPYNGGGMHMSQQKSVGMYNHRYYRMKFDRAVNQYKITPERCTRQSGVIVYIICNGYVSILLGCRY